MLGACAQLKKHRVQNLPLWGDRGGAPALPPQWGHVWVLSFHCVHKPQRCRSLQQSCCLCRGRAPPGGDSSLPTATATSPASPTGVLSAGDAMPAGEATPPGCSAAPQASQGHSGAPKPSRHQPQSPAAWGGGGRGVPVPVAPGPRVLADRWRRRISLGDRPRERCPCWQPGGPGVPRQHPAGGPEPPGPGTTRPQQPRARRRAVPGKGSVDFIAQAG